MELMEGLLYSKSHEWVKEEGDAVVIGLTDYAQSELGDLVFVNLPEQGDEVTVGEDVCRCGVCQGSLGCVFTGIRNRMRGQ